MRTKETNQTSGPEIFFVPHRPYIVLSVCHSLFSRYHPFGASTTLADAAETDLGRQH